MTQRTENLRYWTYMCMYGVVSGALGVLAYMA